jgi:hypothetical protein
MVCLKSTSAWQTHPKWGLRISRSLPILALNVQRDGPFDACVSFEALVILTGHPLKMGLSRSDPQCLRDTAEHRGGW